MSANFCALLYTVDHLFEPLLIEPHHYLFTCRDYRHAPGA
jgi:hypothetical protein